MYHRFAGLFLWCGTRGGIVLCCFSGEGKMSIWPHSLGEWPNTAPRAWLCLQVQRLAHGQLSLGHQPQEYPHDDKQR